MSELTKHSRELGFTIVAVPGNYSVSFRIYKIAGWMLDDERPYWVCGHSDTSYLESADVYLHGNVKWDGCSNWSFDAQEHGMLHCCERDELKRFSDVMLLCWDWASELCPNWSVE